MSNKSKLVSAVMMLVLSLVMLGGASLAWFTISTAPEITGMQVNVYTDIDLLVSKDGENFSQSTSTDNSVEKPQKDSTSIDNLKFYAPLKPISTYDGISWFLPKYQANGFLDDIQNFPLADEEVNANVIMWRYDEESGEYTEPFSDSTLEYKENFDKGYYVYADLWLMTENEDGVDVSISVPNIQSGADHSTNPAMQTWELGDDSEYSKEHGKKYGSYVLGQYKMTDGVMDPLDNNVQNTIRVGFMADEKFTVWEPNADTRSDPSLKPTADQVNEPNYIVDYAIEKDGDENLLNYLDGYYIPTRPIKLENGQRVLADLPVSSLIVQLTSRWKSDPSETPTSADVGTFGRFIKNTKSLYDKLDSETGMTAVSGCEQDLGSVNTIVRLEEANVPETVRVYFWIEGQDVDCWNDVASGSFIVNLEFAAREIPLEDREDTKTE